MKSIVNLLFSMLAIVLLSQCAKDEPNPQVKINDNKFLNALIELGIDINGDGSISFSEAEMVSFLDVSDDSISDLTGIEKFINLDTLLCWGNDLFELNVSKNTTLKYLGCYENQLTNLFLTYNTSLISLQCSGEPLTSMDISNNNALERLELVDMSNLHVICVWEIPFPPDGVEVDTYGSPNLYFTTECESGK